MTSRLVSDPTKIPTRTSFTAWTTHTEVMPKPGTLEKLGSDMIFVLAPLLGIAPPRLLLGISVATNPGEEDTPGAPLHFRIELSLDGLKLTEDQANIVEARIQKALPAFCRVPEAQ